MNIVDIPKLPPDPHAPYQKMYVTLFKAITASLIMLERGEFMLARTILVKAQQDTEEMYIEGNE